MKNYTITVNGNVYNVTVEEGQTSGASAAAPVAAPKQHLQQLRRQQHLQQEIMLLMAAQTELQMEVQTVHSLTAQIPPQEAVTEPSATLQDLPRSS